MKKVLILDRLMVQYRIEFYNQLRDELAMRGILLSIFYGKSKQNDLNAKKNDEVDIEWADYMPTKTYHIGSTEIIWQPYLRHLKGVDLVIIENANRLLLNYYLIGMKRFSDHKIAFWGHYRNMQENANSLKNRFKSAFLTKSDWWFAYTEGQKELLLRQKYAEDQITVVQNAIDTRGIRQYYNEISKNELIELRTELGIATDNVGIFCSSMYPEKRLDFLIEACTQIRKEVTDFHMIFIGSGVDAPKVKEAAKANFWIHYVGPQFGRDRVKYFKLAVVQLMPGLVGLGILDSFALETPIITTDYPYHSPEIEYLENEVNGIVSDNNLENYVGTVIQVLNNKKYRKLINSCRRSAEKYTVETMVNNFSNGVERCLNQYSVAPRPMEAV